MEPHVQFENNLLDFSSSLYGTLDRNETVCISPYSITAALLLVMLGARGTTKSEITSALFKKTVKFNEDATLTMFKTLDEKLTSSAGNDITIKIANRLFVNNQFTVVTKVREQAKQYFGADISLHDFMKPKQSALSMNRWVSNHTNNKIKDLVKEDWIHSRTVMIMINAMYFKATWKKIFATQLTKQQDFYITKTKTTKVDMMRMTTFVKYFADYTLKYSAISLPFKGDGFEMLFILPFEKDGISDIESRMKTSPNFFSGLHSSMRLSNVDIRIPKFKIQTTINLKETLPKIGIKTIFSKLQGNFSELVQERKNGIFVERAVHKVYLDVNEYGVEGAAATGISFAFLSVPEPFIADHPFVFYIREVKTRTMLFLGKFQPKVT